MHPSSNTNRAKLRRKLCDCIEAECISVYSETIENDFRRAIGTVLNRTAPVNAVSTEIRAFVGDFMKAFDKHMADNDMAAEQLKAVAHNASLNMMQRARFDLLHGIALDLANGIEVDKARAMSVLNEIDLDQDGRPDWKPPT